MQDSSVLQVKPIFTRDFWLICLATAFHGTSLMLTNTAMGPYLATFGIGSEFVGGFLATFAFLALLMRFRGARIIQKYGARTTAVVGVSLVAFSSLLYATAPLLPLSLPGGLPLLMPFGLIAQGCGFSMFGTATFALVAQNLDSSRRGEGLGYYTVVMTMTQGIGAGASLALVASWGYQNLYAFSGLMAAISAILVRALHAAPISPTADQTAKSRTVEPDAVLPALACGTLAFATGTAFSFVPLMGVSVGIGNPGLFFAASAAAGLSVRIFGGKIADRYGRMSMIVPGVLFLNMGLWIAGFAVSTEMLVFAGAIFGIGAAAAQPAMQAMVIDSVAAHRHAGASATLWIMQDVGVIAGSFTAGILVPVIGYQTLFQVTGLPTLIGATFTFFAAKALANRLTSARTSIDLDTTCSEEK